ncbi:MAG TPA: aldo/keto reductase [Vicinamibacterales bacterium]|jgi:aryl-alcohol dehydrogenase-like predicted oxidoreductase|nr:aldo/keto reductase [Vicinamibacterales bacterium]
MEYRALGRTGMHVSAIGFGAWAIGGSAWGGADDEASMRALHAAVDAGVNFIDTADVYGDGRSERLVARLRRERPGAPVYVATKAGRRLPSQTPEGYTRENLVAWIDRSLANLEVEAIDLLQLHCPPSSIVASDDVYGVLDDLKVEGKLRHYGVSVERVDEALESLRHPGVECVQIIFNLFRLKPADEFFGPARAASVGVLARVPLASGLLTGKLTSASVFPSDDHRAFNRNGEDFDKGETFSGVPYEIGLEAVEELKHLVPRGETLTQFALRWILMFEAVTCAIPGARTADQARDNAAAADLPAIDAATMSLVRRIYDEKIRPHVHRYW